MERNLEVCEKLLQMVKCKEQFLVSRDLFDLDVLLLLGLRRELRNFEMVGAGDRKAEVEIRKCRIEMECNLLTICNYRVENPTNSPRMLSHITP